MVVVVHTHTEPPTMDEEAGLPFVNPRKVEVAKYLEEKNINMLMNVCGGVAAAVCVVVVVADGVECGIPVQYLMTAVVHDLPEDPRAYVVRLLQDLEDGKLAEVSDLSPPTFFLE